MFQSLLLLFLLFSVSFTVINIKLICNLIHVTLQEIHRRTEGMQSKVSCDDVGEVQPMCSNVSSETVRMNLKKVNKSISCMESCSFIFLRSGGCIVIFSFVWRFFCDCSIFSVDFTVSKDVIKEKHLPQKISSSQCNADWSFRILDCTIMKDVLHNCLLLQALLKLSFPFTRAILQNVKDWMGPRKTWKFLPCLVDKGA